MSAALPLPLQLIWLVPLYGFSGMLLSLPWATGWIKRNGPRPAAYLNLLVTLLAVVHGSLAIREVVSIGPQHLEFAWFQAADLNLRLGFDLSLTNLAALELVTTMSLVCQVFALGYLDKEWSLARFYALVGFFEGAMSGVVLSSNLFMSYFLLEMLTLSTYLLVGFWYAQPLVVTAARDAFLTKRVGDVLLLMGVVALSAWAGSMEFTDLYAWAARAKAEQLISPLAGTLLGLGLIAGPMGKCAQFPMHLWLDEAMEGPNPASILRNSVVVTCGAIVLLKLMPVVAVSPLATTVLLAVGSISAIGGGLVAVAQVDLKRAFSYSTTSYLGLVFITIALQMPGLALLLLFAHGLARALQFMGVGSVIATTNCQDLTELGGLGTRMPATSLAFLVGSAGLVGLLPLGCFWCYGLVIDNLRQLAPGYAALFLLTNALTAVNATRVYRSVFLGPVLPKTKRTPEVNWLMALPMVSLTVIVVLLPWIMQRIDPVPGIASFPLAVGLAVAASGLAGVVIGALLPQDQFWSRSVRPTLRVLQDLLAYDFYTPEIYRRTIVTPVAGLARFTRWFDITVVKGLVDGVGRLSLTTAEGLKLSVSGQLQSYVLTLIVAIVLLLGGLQVLRGWAEPMLLSLLLLIPFLGTLTLLLWPGSPSPARLRLITIAILVLQLGASLAVAIAFDPALPGLQLQELHRWVPGIGLDYALGVDGLSLPLVLINSGLTLVSAVITRDLDKRPRIYFAMLLLISGAVNGAFLANNLLLFFLFYELELIPLWLLVSVWGGVNRAYAATKFLIFTAVSGMLILGAFLGLALLTGSVDFSLSPVLSERLAMGGQLWLLGALLIGFGIKIPLVPLHNWLPDAHTQASTPVSVLLAGVLLKLGTYGMLRFGLQLFPEAWAKLAPALAIWAAISVLYGSLAAIAQTDMKRMVAYSSVGHMGYVLLAAAADTPVSLLGAVFQMVSHGLISALLFLLVGIVYRKTGTRDLEVLRGLLNPEKGLPFTGTLMIVAVMASAGLPGMAGFISEFLVFRGSINVFPLATLLSMVGSGLTAVYFLLLVNRAFFGRLAITPPSGDPVEDARLDVQLAPVAPRETFPAIALAAGVVLLGVVPSSLGRISEVATTALAAITAVPGGWAEMPIIPAELVQANLSIERNEVQRRLLAGETLLSDTPDHLLEVVDVLKSYGEVLDAYSINLIYQAEQQFLNPLPIFKYLDGDLSPAKIWRHLNHDRINFEYAEYCQKAMFWHATGGMDAYLDSDAFAANCRRIIAAKRRRDPLLALLNPLFPGFLPELIRSAATTHALGQFWRVMSDLFLDLAAAEADGRVRSIPAVVEFIKDGLVAAAANPITYAVEIGGETLWVLPPEAGLTFLVDVAVPYVEAVFLRGMPFLGTVSFNAQAQQIAPDQAQFTYGALYADPLPSMGAGIPSLLMQDMYRHLPERLHQWYRERTRGEGDVRVKICMSFQKSMFCVTNAAINGTMPHPLGSTDPAAQAANAAYAGAWAQRLGIARTDCLAA